MELSRSTDLAVQLLRVLAVRGGRLKGPDLAERVSTSTSFLPQVMAPLIRAGWVVSTAGAHGGYELIVSPDALSLLDVIEACEGSIVEGRCVLRPQSCPAEDGTTCVLHDSWEQARTVLLDGLSSSSIWGLQDVPAPTHPGTEPSSNGHGSGVQD